MKEIKVIPAIMPSVNWTGISLLCREVGIDDPIKALDSNNIKHGDPAAILQGLNCPECCVLGFLLYYPSCPALTMISLMTAYKLQVRRLGAKNNDLVVIMFGDFTTWLNAIRQGCSEAVEYTDRVVFNKILEAIETTNLKIYFRQYKRKTLSDGSMILCI
jgi:hypothetical protein